MAASKKQRKALPPIWRLSDELWAEVEPILAELDPPKRFGPKRVAARPILDAIIYRGRTGCQWNRLPAEYPDDSTVHRAFQRWRAAGVFARLWATLIERCADLDGCDWEWQVADGALGKARLGGTSWAPTPLIGPSPA
jgi:putative transposase